MARVRYSELMSSFFWKRFTLKFQINGQESEIIDSTCNEKGIRVLTFSKPHGPFYHYQEATNITFGDQPNLRDPLDKKYVNIKETASFDFAGEGTYASRDIPENITFVLLGGYLYDNEQRKILIEHNMEIARLNNWANDNPEFEKQWMYR